MTLQDSLAISRSNRIVFICISICGLIAVFLFQNESWANSIVNKSSHPYAVFVINRTLRLLFNDLFMLILLASWFQSKTVLKLAFAIQLIDLFILLPLYLTIKLHFEGDTEISSPLLSQFHRLIVNPTLMILLIPAVYFQRLTNKE